MTGLSALRAIIGGPASEKDGDADCDDTRVPAATYRVRICEEHKPKCVDAYHL